MAGTTVSRFCASGLQAVAEAAGRIVADGESLLVAGGPGKHLRTSAPRPARDAGDNGIDPWLAEHVPSLYAAMIDTADTVAARYGVSREAQDALSLEPASSAPRRPRPGRPFRDEIVPVTATMAVTDKATGSVTRREVTVDRDTCNRPDTTAEGLAALAPVRARAAS
jgi:acetyl-CoA C-acetyltransferase